MKNANDCTGAYELMAGLYRCACLNSLVAMVSELSSCNVRHTGNVADKVIEGTFAVIDESRKALAAPDAWSSDAIERRGTDHLCQPLLTKCASVSRSRASALVTAIEPVQLLQPRRWEDRSNDLWTTLQPGPGERREGRAVELPRG